MKMIKEIERERARERGGENTEKERAISLMVNWNFRGYFL
jgi:hypothetical protein